MEITSNIYQIGGQKESHPSDASIYLIKSGNEAAIVDSGTGKGIDETISNITATSTNLYEIKYIFLTHCHYDHSGGMDMLRAKTGCKSVAHEITAEFIEAGDSEVTAAAWYGTHMDPVKIDIRVKGKESKFRIGDLDINFYHTPGHSPDSSVLTVESDGKLVLFGQDVHGPLNDTLRSNRKEYIEYLKFLLSLNSDILCEGHFGVYYGKKNIREFIESYL